MKDLFDTQQKIDEAIASFTSMQTHPGWILIQTIGRANMELLAEQLENGMGEKETKADIDRIRDKLKILREFINTPEDMIKKLQPHNDEEITTDPFDTVETLKKRRGLVDK